jgi:predicted acyl esterase
MAARRSAQDVIRYAAGRIAPLEITETARQLVASRAEDPQYVRPYRACPACGRKAHAPALAYRSVTRDGRAAWRHGDRTELCEGVRCPLLVVGGAFVRTLGRGRYAAL